VLLHPILTGGGQEDALRAGTENYIGIASLGIVSNEISQGKLVSSGLRDAFEAGITRRIAKVRVNGGKVDRVPNTSSITFEGVHSLAMLTALEEEGVCASAGAACSSRQVVPSRTLKSMGLTDEAAMSTVRFSFSRMSKMMDAATAIEACVKCARILRQSTGSSGE